VSSQGQKESNKIVESWGINFPVIGDPSLKFVKTINEKGWIKSYILESVPDKLTKLIGYSYENGLVQPGVIALQGSVLLSLSSKGEEKKPKVLLSWGLVPTKENKQGAMNRLSAGKTWNGIKESLSGNFEHSHPDIVQKNKGEPQLPTFLFFSLVMANGNFLKPKAFTFDSNGEGDIMKLVKLAFAKLLFVIAATCVGYWRNPSITCTLVASYGAYFLMGPYKIVSSVLTSGDAYTE